MIDNSIDQSERTYKTCQDERPWKTMKVLLCSTHFYSAVSFSSQGKFSFPEQSWRQCMGAIHSTKISGLRFENFLVSNGSRPVRTVSFQYTHKTSFALI